MQNLSPSKVVTFLYIGTYMFWQKIYVQIYFYYKKRILCKNKCTWDSIVIFCCCLRFLSSNDHCVLDFFTRTPLLSGKKCQSERKVILCLVRSQRSFWPGSQSVTFDIISRCFENKNNNCCETKNFKNAICLLLTNLKIHNLVTLLPSKPQSSQKWISKFVNYKQMAVLQIFVSHQLFKSR